MAIESPVAKQQFFDANGNPLVGGKLYIYEAGTTTPATTWTDKLQTAANANPIILDSRGECVIWLDTESAYKYVLKTALDVEVYSVDNVNGALAIDNLRTDLAADDGSSLVGYIAEGTGAVATTVQAKLRESVSVLDFGANTTPGTTDMTAIIQAAFDSLSANQTLVFPSGLYKTDGVVTITTNAIGVDFQNVTFYVGDTGTPATTVLGSVGIVGYHFKQVSNLKITGTAKFIGLGTSGVTSLLGVMFDTCTEVSCPAFMRFETMAIGRTIATCVRCHFGDAQGNDMNGLQTFEAPPTNNAGSVETVSATTYSDFGNVIAYNNEKPARYLSVSSAGTDNISCVFGKTVCDGVDVSPTTAHALALRSAVDCYFGGVVANNCTAAVLIQQYSTDAAFSVTRNTIASISGTFPSTAASLDAVVEQSTTSTNPIGSNTVLNLDVICEGEVGVFVSSGQLNIHSAKMTGAASRFLAASNASGTGQVTLNIGTLTLGAYSGANECVRIGNGVDINIDYLDIQAGPSTAITAPVSFATASGTGAIGSMHIGAIKYRVNGAASNYTYVLVDVTNNASAWNIGTIDGVGSSATGRSASFADGVFNIKGGNLYKDTAPATTAHTVGETVYNSVPAAAGTMGWICTTAGTPGTWKTFGAIAA